jgi:hypothetical protein
MPMVSMNVQDDEAVRPADYDPCPCIYLNEDQVEALGITTPPEAGTRVKLTCMAVFQSVTQNAMGEDGDKDISLSLKITDMEIGSAGNAGKNAGTLYNGGAN